MRTVHLWLMSCATLLLLAGCETAPPSLNESLVASRTPLGYTSSLFTIPTITFRRPLGEEAPFPEGLKGGARVRATLESMIMRRSGQEVAGSWTWLEQGKVAAFVPAGLLPTDSQLYVEARIRYEVEQDGKWELALFKGEPVETYTYFLTTNEQVPEDHRITSALSLTQGQTNVSPAVDVVATSQPRLYRELRRMDNTPFPVRAEVEELALYQGSTRLAGRFETETGAFGERRLEPEALLPPRQLLRAVAKVRWARRVDGVWRPVEGTTVTTETSFTTADYDPLAGVHEDNVATGWPRPRQLYFHWGEVTEGQLRLKRGQDALLAGLEGQELEARFTRPSGQVASVLATYTQATRTFRFAIPPSLQPQTVYVLQLVARPQGGAERTVFRVPFRTSRYATFDEKWLAVSGSPVNYYILPKRAGVIVVGAQFRELPEGFDAFETGQQGGRLQAEAIWEGNTWYEQTAAPLMYRELLAGNPKLKLTWDRPPDLGLPPVRAVYMNPTPRVLTDEEVASDSVTLSSADRIASVAHDVMDVVMRDFDDLRQQTANHPERNTDPWLQQLDTKSAPYLTRGTAYRVKLRYEVPGKTPPPTEHLLDILYQ